MAHETLTLGDVKALGSALVEVADRYPTRFLTEIDFYPLVVAFLAWKAPELSAEFPVGNKRAIDFKVHGTSNPAFLELAVAPRVLGDLELDQPKKFPNKTQLYATQNRSELRKLSKEGGATKGRFLLLVDLRADVHDVSSLKKKYKAEQPKLPGGEVVNVVYVHRSLADAVNIKLKNSAKAASKKAAKKKASKKPKKKASKKP